MSLTPLRVRTAGTAFGFGFFGFGLAGGGEAAARTTIAIRRSGAATAGVAVDAAVNVMVCVPAWAAEGVQAKVAVAGFPGWLSRLAPAGSPWLPIRTWIGTPPAADAASGTVTRALGAAPTCAPSAGVGDCHDTTFACAPDHGRAEAVPAASANTNRAVSAQAARL